MINPVKLLNEDLARKCAKYIKVSKPYGFDTKAVNIFALYENRMVIDEIFDVFLKQFNWQSYSIITLSEWGIPLTVLLGRHIFKLHNYQATFYYCGERVFRRTKDLPLLQPSLGIMVDDTINNGDALIRFLRSREASALRQAGTMLNTLFVILDNDDAANKDRPGLKESMRYHINVIAATRSSYVFS